MAISRGLKMGREVTVISGFSGIPLQGGEKWVNLSFRCALASGRLAIASTGGDHERPLGRRC